MKLNQGKKEEPLVLCEASLIEDMKLAVDAECYLPNLPYQI